MQNTKEQGSKTQDRIKRSKRPAKGRKSKKQLRKEALREIQKVYEEFDQKMKLLKGAPIGGIYSRYSSRFQDSIASQVRSLLEFAIREKIYIPLENINFDVAVRGSKRNREGLTKTSELLKSKRAKVLLVFKTNRLFRKTYRSLEYIDRAVKTWNARLIFVKDHLDSNSPDFHGIKLQILAMLDEHGSKVHVENVVAQHLFLATQNIITCTVTYGYEGVDLPGQLTRRGLPRRSWAICEDEADYVRKIFDWFVNDRLSIAEIVRRLNQDRKAPLTPRSGGTWTRLAVRTILANERYLGIFKYGEKQNVELPDVDYVVRQQRDEALLVVTVDELRITKPRIWFKAQSLLKEKRSRGGRRRRRSSKPTGSEIIRGLCSCPKHDCKTWISGDSIFCPECQKEPREERCLVSKLPTQLATKLILEKLVEEVLQDEWFVFETHREYVKLLENCKHFDPDEVQRWKNRSDELGRRIQALKLDKGVSAVEIAESEESIRELRAERDELISKIVALDSRPRHTVMPTMDDTRDRLRKLGNKFLESSGSRDPVVLGRLHRMLRLLTGGEIILRQQGGREPRKGWIQAEFVVCLGAALSGDDEIAVDETSFPTRHVTIDFRRPCEFQDESEKAYQMDVDEGIPRKEIGKRLGCSKSKVTKLLKYACQQRGEPFVDGRSRRRALSTTPPVYDRIIQRVMELYDDDWLLQSIADEVEVCKDTVTRVVHIWHQKNGVQLEDGRRRRKRLAVKSRPKAVTAFN